MQQKIKVTPRQLLNIYTSKKDFFLYRIENKKLISYMLTNDLTRHRAQYNNKFKLLVDIKKQIYKLNIKI